MEQIADLSAHMQNLLAGFKDLREELISRNNEQIPDPSPVASNDILIILKFPLDRMEDFLESEEKLLQSSLYSRTVRKA